MQFKSLLFASVLLSVWTVLVSTNRDPSNPPTGNTGAPNETTCQKSGCHSGGNFTGTVSISGIPDTIQANTPYTVVLKITSACIKAGFQMTCLNKDNVKCGTFTAGAGSNVITNNVLQRDYIRQSSAKTLANGSASWTFTWKSPAVLPADSIKFYFVSLQANNNGGNSGDNVAKGSKKVITTTTSRTDAPVAFEQLATVYPNPINDIMLVTLKDGKNGTVQVIDAKGGIVRDEAVQGSKQLTVNELPNGIYIVKVTVDGQTALKKVIK
jgi:Secretion system C-terminal sorting domain